MIKVNGEEYIAGADMSLKELLAEKGYNSAYVAVELNGAIVPRDAFKETRVKGGDAVEIVTFVGGG